MTDRLAAIAETLTELGRRERENKLASYVPYAKQLAFHELGASKRERMLFAGSQLGKTHSAAMETAMHTTGRYPPWWTGYRFKKAVKGWVGSQSAAAQRDAAQAKLLGTSTPFSTPDQVGTGAIPKDCIVKIVPTRGVADSVDTIIVKHVSGEVSTLTFKTYEMEMAKWAGSTLDLCWADEEPPHNIYVEALARTTATKGILYCTFTPLSGATPLTARFLDEGGPDRAYVRMTAYDVADNGHLTKADVDAQLARLPEWERQARIYGLPAQGHGRIIQCTEDVYVIEPCQLQTYWPRIIGLDIGFTHFTAAVWLAWDRDRNRLIAYDEYAAKGLKISNHAAALIANDADQIPVAWPHDAGAHEHATGESVMRQYKKLNVNMLATHASSPEHGNSLWASATDLTHRLQNGQLTIISTCRRLRDELMGWHQKDGRIVDENDDLISALRYGVMMHKKARVMDFRDPFKRAHRASQPQFAKGLDVSPWASIDM